MKMSNRVFQLIIVIVAFIAFIVIIDHKYFAESRNFADMKIEKEYSFIISNIVEFPKMRRNPNGLFIIATNGDSIRLAGSRVNSNQKYLDEVVSAGDFVLKKENDKVFTVKTKDAELGKYEIFDK